MKWNGNSIPRNGKSVKQIIVDIFYWKIEINYPSTESPKRKDKCSKLMNSEMRMYTLQPILQKYKVYQW